MRGAATALAAILALSAHAQTPPDTPAAPPAQAPAPAAPAAADTPAEAPAAQGQPPAETSAPAPPPPPRETAAPPVPRAGAARAPASHAQPPAAPAAAAADHEGELATLRAEVSRLQAELDAERAAAAVPPAEDAAAIPGAVRSVWEWTVIAALLALAGGFVLGWRVLDRRIRAKYGGLRIY